MSLSLYLVLNAPPLCVFGIADLRVWSVYSDRVWSSRLQTRRHALGNRWMGGVQCCTPEMHFKIHDTDVPLSYYTGLLGMLIISALLLFFVVRNHLVVSEE